MRIKYLFLSILLVVAVFAAPILAQGDPVHTVAFDGASFTFDEALARAVNITVQPADAETTFPPEVGHVQFLLYNAAPAPESLFDAVGGVRVYRAADFAEPGFEASADQVAALRDLLAERPDLAAYQTDDPASASLPFLPVLPAGQTMRAQAAYVDAGSVSGVRYVTAWQQAAEPLLSDSLLYTFVGLSQDGQHVVAVVFRLHTDLLPAEMGPDFDMASFVDGLAAYQAETTAMLNAAAPDAFTPALDSLDALVSSLAFAG